MYSSPNRESITKHLWKDCERMFNNEWFNPSLRDPISFKEHHKYKNHGQWNGKKPKWRAKRKQQRLYKRKEQNDLKEKYKNVI
ncbi:MAG: hypothetical protein ACOCRX_00950 [Candidatus Woesearchaeota archaeon]